jgi:histidinol-phosphate aminotransferase
MADARTVPQAGPAATAPAPVRTPSQVYTWEPSSTVLAARYGLRPEDILRFDLNTSPTPPAFLADVLPGPYDPPLNEYPDSLYSELTEAAAAYVGVDPSEVLVGAGADEVLDIIAKTFLPAGGRAVVPVPTYSMYGVLTTQRDARLVAVPRAGADEGFRIDPDAVVAALREGAQVAWLCAPNNPTGTREPEEGVLRVLDAAHEDGPDGPVVVVDEAYIEFAPGSWAGHRARYPRLVVVRTVSKAFGLAGVRVGYAVASRPTIERLERLRPPGSISTISATVAAAALRRPEVARANVVALEQERDWLAERLRELGLPPYPSVTNFLLCVMGDQAAAESATEHLLRAGIVTRTFGPAHPLRGHLRFTVRTRAENERFLDVIGDWLRGGRA